jgi:hypothetical protein
MSLNNKDGIRRDDITGAPGASTVRFGLDGSWYEVDLTPIGEEVLRTFLQQYIVSGMVGRSPRPESA